VRDTIVAMHERGVWVELTTLIIPGLNDDRRDLRVMAEWIATAVGPETPWHLTRFQPTYRLSGLAETPDATLVDAAAIAREVGLRHVYVGNAPEVEASATICAHCGERLIGRSDFAVTEWRLVDGRCPRCRHALAGVGLEDSPVIA
jgi:pyruvate formate lyase activating enzyme